MLELALLLGDAGCAVVGLEEGVDALLVGPPPAGRLRRGGACEGRGGVDAAIAQGSEGVDGRAARG